SVPCNKMQDRVFRIAAMPLIRAIALFAVFMVVGRAQDARLHGMRVYEGDILVSPDSSFTGLTPARLWTNNTVPYIIDSDIPSPQRITDAVNYYNQSTLLKFQARASEADYLHYVRSTLGDGVCYSTVGMAGGEQFIHVDDACSSATLIHEMGHT